MRNYIILNGNNSNEITGLLIQSLPPISKPLMRTAIEEIDGRDGDIVTNLGYSAYDKEVSIGLYGSYDVDAVIKYFSDNSKGQVTFSNEPDKYYNYEIINQIDFERLIRFKTAIVTLHCQPFKYLTDETPVEIAYQYVNNEAEEMDLDNTADAPMELDLKGNIEQDSTTGKNLFDIGTDLTNDYFITTSNGKYINTSISVSSRFTGDITNNSIVITNIVTTNYPWLSKFIKLEKNTQYTIQLQSSSALSPTPIICGANSDTQGTTGTQIGSLSNGVLTFNSGEYDYYWLAIYFGANSNTISNIQIEKGSTATEYEPYTNGASPNPDYPQDIHIVSGDNTIEICGKNKIPNNQVTQTINDITFTINDDGSIKVNGTASARTDLYLVGDSSNYKSINIQNGDYVLSGSIGGSSSTYGLFLVINRNGTTTIKSSYDGVENMSLESTDTFRIFIRVANGAVVDTTIYPMLRLSNTTSNYEKTGATYPINLPSGMELCKIGNYQDRLFKADNNDDFYKTLDSATKQTLTYGKWYLHKEIGKVVFDGSEESWRRVDIYQGISQFEVLANDVLYANDGVIRSLSNFFKGIPYNNSWAYDNSITSVYTSRLRVMTSMYSSVDDFKAWLSTHNTIVYYVLATPTDTEITDTTLLEQLENIVNARSYDTSTHITQNANDKPFILNATAIQKGSDTGIVDNDGNIYSKPTLDIEGTGTVAIYLNGNQMFSVDLSNSDECVIDVTNLEAYDPETNELMNRQVTGDYSKFTLPVGENEVKVSGNVTKATITDYTRWL